MSFFVPSELTIHPNFAVYKDVHEADEWEAGVVVDCFPPEPFEPYTIDAPVGTTINFSADPVNTTFFGLSFTSYAFADYYTLTVRFNAPSDFASWFDPPACKDEEPFEWGLAGPDLDAVIGGSLVSGTGVSVPSTYNILGHAMNSWIVEAYLVNPSPVWPTPDGEGNTFGSVLFTEAQIPAITGSISIETGPGVGYSQAGILQAHVQPYFVNEGEPEEEELFSYIRGSA